MENKVENNVDSKNIENNKGTITVAVSVGIVIILIILLLYLYSKSTGASEPIEQKTEDLKEPDDESDTTGNKPTESSEPYDPSKMKCLGCGEEYESDAIICLNCNRLFKWKDDMTTTNIWGKVADGSNCLYCKNIVKCKGTLNDGGRLLTCTGCSRHYIRDDDFDKNDLYNDSVDSPAVVKPTNFPIKKPKKTVTWAPAVR